MKRWPAGVMALGSSFAGESVSDRKRCSMAHTLFSSSEPKAPGSI